MFRFSPFCFSLSAHNLLPAYNLLPAHNRPSPPPPSVSLSSTDTPTNSATLTLWRTRPSGRTAPKARFRRTSSRAGKGMSCHESHGTRSRSLFDGSVGTPKARPSTMPRGFAATPPRAIRSSVRQLRHHFGPSFRDIWALYHPTHAVYCALRGYHAYWMLIGACDPML